MAEPEPQNSVGLSEGLRGQFAALEKRLWNVDAAKAAGFAAAGLLISYLLLFVSDRFWETPIWLRALFAASGLAALGWAFAQWLNLWVLHRRNQRQLAILVQSKYKRLGDRLLGIVELADEQQRPVYFSPALYRAAIQQVSSEAAQFDFEAAVDPRPAKRRILSALGIALLLIPLFALTPAAAWNSFHRWAAPLAAVPRFTLVKLDGLPSQQIVPHGEPFAVSAAVQYRSFWKPASASAQFRGQSRVSKPVENGRVQFTLPGQVREGPLKVRVGDAAQTVLVRPAHRPALKELNAAIQFPAYLQYSNATVAVPTGTLTLLEGSRASFQGKISRALAEAHLLLEKREPSPLQINGENFSTEWLDLLDAGHCSFTWRDAWGLDNAVPWRLNILAEKDAPPMPEIPQMAREMAILETEVLPIRAIARDDYGIRSLGLRWSPAAFWVPTNSLASQEFSFSPPTSQETVVEHEFQFSPTLLKIPADAAIDLQVFATDFFPGRDPAFSPLFRVHVLGVEKHAELVRQKLETLLARLEEVQRLEEKIATNTHQLQAAAELDPDATSEERIEEARKEQLENAEQLEKLSKEGVKTLREAVRNPTFTDQSLSEWAKTLQEMQQLSSSKMQQAAASLKKAQDNPASKAGELAEALSTEEEILQDLEQLQRNVNEGLDQLQALTLAQRLRKLSAEEKELEIRLHRNIPHTIGLMPQELPERFQKANQHLSKEQEQAFLDLQTLEGEISRFFERSQRENYGEVSREMKDQRTTEELDRVRHLIQENISLEAAQNLASWSAKFNEWADQLEPKSESGGGGGGSGSGGSGPNLVQDLIALLRVREREINLRRQTRLLDQERDANPFYPETAQTLAESQRKLIDDLGKIELGSQIPPLQAPLAETSEIMESVEGLLQKPQTDSVTTRAETAAIELLSDVINLVNEQAQQGGSGSQGASSEEMAFLMQMMAPGQALGMAPGGRTPGMNMAGGTTADTSPAPGGDDRGNAAEARGVSKASGITGTIPIEFRQALENYFNAVERPESK